MTSITSYTSVRGLDLQSNPWVGTPGTDAGVRTATTVADNCILAETRMIGNRKGMTYFSQATPAVVDAFSEYQNYIIEHEQTGALYRDVNTGGSRTAYSGTYLPPAGYT